MTRARTLALRAGSVLAVLLLLPLCVYEAAYQYGLGRIRDLPSPVPTEGLPSALAHALWVSAGEAAPMRIQPVRVWHALSALGSVLLFQQPEPLPGERAALEAARLTLLRQPRDGMLEWHLMTWALTVRLTRRWSPEQVAHFIGQNGDFGRGTQGIAPAARVYFDKDVSALAPEEIALLMVLKTSQTRFNPDCHPERALAGRHRFLLRLLADGALTREQFDTAETKPIGVLPDSSPRCR